MLVLNRLVFTAQYVRTTRGAYLIVFDGRLYRQQCKANKEGRRTWYCVMYGRTQCPSIITTDCMNYITSHRRVHNHPAPVIIQTPNGIIHKHSRRKTRPRVSARNAILP